MRYASAFGAGLVEFQRYNEALNVLDEAIHTANSSRSVAYPSIAINSKIDALRGLHRYREALVLADDAIRRLPQASLDGHLFQILTSKGEIYGDLGQWGEAAAQYSRALQYARHLNYWRGITQTAGLLAQAYENEDQLDPALTAIDEALKANEQLPHELYFAPRNLAIKAEILDKLGRARQSRGLYEKSLALIDSLIATAPTPDLERDVLTQLGVVYTGYFHSLVRQGDLAGAFGVVEKARGRIEAQALEDHTLVSPHQPTEQEDRITQLSLNLLKADDPSSSEELEIALHTSEGQADDAMLAAITAKRPMSLRLLQRHLQPDELVLEYVLTDPVSWVLAITRTTAHKYDLVSRSTIEAQCKQYRKTILSQKEDPATAESLFQELLASVPEYRTSHSIIVIPDGTLHLLPISALRDGNSYVIESHSVSDSPSSTVLGLLRDREKSTRRNAFQYVGVAAWPGSSQGQNVVMSSAVPLHGPPIQPLPESRREVEEVAQDLPPPGTILLGPEATETRFKDLPLSQYRLFHLALHG